MLHRDPPEHTRLRKLVSAAFTQRRISALAPRIEQITDELLDKMAYSDTVDLIDSFAFPLPMAVIGHLLGVPPGDMSRFAAGRTPLQKGRLPARHPRRCGSRPARLHTGAAAGYQTHLAG